MKSFAAPVLLTLNFVSVANCWADPTFKEMFDVLKAKSETADRFTIGDALAELKRTQSITPLFNAYTLIKDSFSIQTGTVEAPRSLMFGNTAQLIVTFAADSQMEGGYALESADFDSAGNNILFREVIAKDDIQNAIKSKLNGAKLKDRPRILREEFDLSPREIEFENDKIVVTRPNPVKCMNCHSLFPNEPRWARYIWDAYPEWPHAYGSYDDRIDAQEKKSLSTFAANYASNDRYSTLTDIDNPSLHYSDFKGGGRGGHFGRRPNLQLTEYLMIRQAKVLAQYLLEKASLIDLVVYKLAGYRLESLLKPLLQMPGYSLEATMSIDRQTVTCCDAEYNFGEPTLLSRALGSHETGFSLRAYTLQELTFQVYPNIAQDVHVKYFREDPANENESDLSLESFQFMRSRRGPPREIRGNAQ